MSTPPDYNAAVALKSNTVVLASRYIDGINQIFGYGALSELVVTPGEYSAVTS